jgi:hypothetical protein
VEERNQTVKSIQSIIGYGTDCKTNVKSIIFYFLLTTIVAIYEKVLKIAPLLALP